MSKYRLAMIEANRRYKKKRVEKGICTACENDICEESSVYCKEHLNYHREYQRKYIRPKPFAKWIHNRRN